MEPGTVLLVLLLGLAAGWCVGRADKRRAAEILRERIESERSSNHHGWAP